MEEELNNLKKQLEDFCEKYGATITAETECYSRMVNGSVSNLRVRIKLIK